MTLMNLSRHQRQNLQLQSTHLRINDIVYKTIFVFTNLPQLLLSLAAFFSTQFSSSLVTLTRVMMREPKAAVPRWKTVVCHIARRTEGDERRLSGHQNQRENREARTRSEKAEQKDRLQYSPKRF